MSAFLVGAVRPSGNREPERGFNMSAFHDLTLKALNGQDLPLAPFKGQVVLVVNVASKCGLTPQYASLEKLQQQFKGKGFNVLGLPCNQFAGQEPGSEKEIQEFCSLNYGVSFPLGAKLEVNGPQRHSLYRLLAGEGAEFPGDISWNFEKFLVGKDGRVLARFAPRTAPDDPTVVQAIEKALG
ncbi:glutathione peroxidase [Pseudomonas sp. BR1R-5]|jgi:glutathione peroxidase|nr:glutathione peroxidase [Pseudomonas sp. BR1R-5]